jgi:NADP-dependent 3-hydroxy acid dehydrogenase YdfG
LEEDRFLETMLSGKSVLVTGASAGIGRATVLALTRAGAKVLATGRRTEELDRLKSECGRHAGSVELMAGDLNDARFVEKLAAAAREVEIFVNNAGLLKYAPLLDTSDADTEEMFRTNVLAAFRITRAIAKAMVERKRGHIIVMSSIAAREVYALGGIYCATKHALSAITRSLRLELGAQGIKVSEIAPGMVDTDIRRTSDHPAAQASFKARKYLPISVEDVAAAVVYVAQTSHNNCPDLIELRPRAVA